MKLRHSKQETVPSAVPHMRKPERNKDKLIEISDRDDCDRDERDRCNRNKLIEMT